MMDVRQMRLMELHSTQYVDNRDMVIEITRVPGGWLYRMRPGSSNERFSAHVFVPE